MGKELHMSKPFAVMAVAMTVSAVAGIITMIILYQIQITPMNPTPRPTPLPTTTLPTGPPPSMRLPGNLVPKSYQLYFQPHLYSSIDLSDVNATEQNLTFTGNSTVVFQCVQKTKSIFLHSNNLTLLELYVTNVDTKKIVPHLDYKEYDDGTHFLEVQMTDALTDGGNYSLFVAFQGEMQDDLSGMYVSTYNEDGLKKYVVATQLEATDARKMFPCFDEPALKATFDVTIIHRLDTTALGNWDKKLDSKNIIDDEWKYTRFNPTKLMSTYLLAFAVSEFPLSLGDPTTSRIDIKTYARKDAIDAGQADYASSITGKLLKIYEEHFGINYVLPKLDQFVVPDHRAAAMENWGLIMYQESSLLYDKKTTSLLQKDWIVEIVAHELAHQWFGNLVTMRWWNDLWLNEGFSSYMANLAVAKMEPDWNMKQIREMYQRLGAFEIDALNSSHPLSPPANQIQTRDEIGEMFSTITYCKGAAVLTMLAGYLTERVFDAGIKMYLKEFQFKNTETQDVWNSMQKAVEEAHLSGINVTEIMNTWTEQIGYPVVTINTTEGEAYQKKFTLSPATEAGRVWHIPMRVMSKTSGPLPKQHYILPSLPVHKDEFLSKKGEWILVNATGYFRVNYNPENWRRLLDQLEMDYTVIAVMERGQLIDDAFNLAGAKLVNITLALNTTRFLRNDTECLTWGVAIKNLNYFVDMFDRSIVYGPMQVYMRNLVCPLYTFFQIYTDNSSIPTDSSQQENQVNAINMACSNGLPACQKMARTMFRQWMNNETNNRINPNLRSAIYCQAVAAGGDKEWEFAWKIYKNTTIDQERDQLTHALSCTTKIWLLSRLLEYTLDPEKIRKSDVLDIITAVGNNPVGQSLAWNFLRSHWLVLRDELGPSYVLKDLAKRFSTEVELQELKQFQMAENAMESRLMNQAIEQTEANIQWVKEHKQTVLNWFMANLSPGNSTPCYLETFV
ncbi:unnamed protein product [Merluccius merluccius]